MAIGTNKEYLTKALAKFDITEDDVDVMLAENPALNGDGSLDVRACKTAIYNSLSNVLPLSNVSESGFSRSWNMEALKMWYSALCTELGKVNRIKPKIRNKSNLW